MKRQPFRPAKGDSWSIAPHLIEDMQKLAELIGRITVNWSGVDLHLSLLLGSLLGVESGASVAVFTSLRQHRTQRDALKAAARGTLSDDLLDLFEALMLVHEQLDKQRNSAVHCVWGRADKAPDGIIWCSVEKHGLALIREYHLEKSGRFDGREERLIEDCFVVKYDDLEDLNREIMSLADAARNMHAHLRYRAEPAGENALKAVVKNPLVEQALIRVKQAKDPQAK